jgi:hypothetical protein
MWQAELLVNTFAEDGAIVTGAWCACVSGLFSSGEPPGPGVFLVASVSYDW